MPTLHLTNVTIKQLTDKNSNPYYLIINNEDQEEVFFCFLGTVNQEGWQELEDNWEHIKEVEIEYVERVSGLRTFKRVVNLQVNEFKDLGEVF